MTAHVSILLKSHVSLTSFRACFHPGQAKDLPAPLHTHFTDLTFVPRQMNMKQVPNIHDETYRIYKRTH